ncbi:MAG TPA: hypothetical protein VFG30_30630 [Polyangiales bacterium]|nr:hypothetical protein [Polyangiales bacterium]
MKKRAARPSIVLGRAVGLYSEGETFLARGLTAELESNFVLADRAEHAEHVARVEALTLAKAPRSSTWNMPMRI